MWVKILGGLSFFLGLLITVYFPMYSGKYQTEAMSKTGILVGVILMILGLLAVFW